MANDRLFLVCTTCGRGVMLYKYYPSGGYVPDDIQKRVDTFIGRHLGDHEDSLGGASYFDVDQFTLKTEVNMTSEEWSKLSDPWDDPQDEKGGDAQ